jgi:hypothetical protein
MEDDQAERDKCEQVDPVREPVVEPFPYRPLSRPMIVMPVSHGQIHGRVRQSISVRFSCRIRRVSGVVAPRRHTQI